MHIHAYSLKKNTDGHRLDLAKRFSTDTDGIAKCLGLQSEARVDLEVIYGLIEQKITARTLFSLNQAPPPISVNPQE
jgi:hypothetical protein